MSFYDRVPLQALGAVDGREREPLGLVEGPLCALLLRAYFSTGYGLRFSTEIYDGQTVFHEYLQEYCFVLTDISGNLRKPPGVCERM